MIVIKNDTVKKTIRIAVPVFAAAAALLCGIFVRDGRKYSLVAALVALLSLLLFFSGYDRRVTGSRRLVLGAVFIALAVIGRFIPAIKPVTAITVIAGMYLGGETGFLVGSLTALISNIWFGQGPWTPLQMTALGLIGLFAGIFSEKLKKSRVFLVIFAVLSAIFYSAFMDVWASSFVFGSLGAAEYLASLLSSLQFTIIYIVSNVLYLLLLVPAFGKKFERIRVKYGI